MQLLEDEVKRSRSVLRNSVALTLSLKFVLGGLGSNTREQWPAPAVMFVTQVE